MTIVGTRPEIIRLSRTIDKLDRFFDHVLVHTGQNYDYELNQIFFDELNIRKPDIFLETAGETSSETIGQVIIESDRVIRDQKPDALLILGDTNSCLAAISAKRNQVPIFHVEAGNRCFDFRVPEEINRRIVDHISDINLTYSQIARDYLLREGLPADRVICTGSPMKEVLDFYHDAIYNSTILKVLNLQERKYFLVSCHREENVDRKESLQKLILILDQLVRIYDVPIIFSAHPRTQKMLKKHKIQLNQKVKLSRPFGFTDYVNLQQNALCVLSDSGTISEESSILNFPALNLREVHERPEGFEEGAVMMVGLNIQTIIEALTVLETQGRGQNRTINLVNDYSQENFSEKIIRIICSYTGFVNRKVWSKF
ncbi:UDP-N-acetylglucosamine 2-epimerase (non-hydrolyzing) [Planktomarina temperata]|nr:UDP-N-acetylglucosamine 2-epimerase (non-hydrolyzing) [Planktomarina temperata]